MTVWRSLTVRLSAADFQQLQELSQREYRRPRDQAAILVLAGLNSAGFDVEFPVPRRGADATHPPVVPPDSRRLGRASDTVGGT